MCVGGRTAALLQAENAFAEALPEIYDRHRDLFLSAPRYLGVEELGDSAVVVRVVAQVTEENFFTARRALNREIKLLLDARGIEIPFPQLVVHRGQDS